MRSFALRSANLFATFATIPFATIPFATIRFAIILFTISLSCGPSRLLADAAADSAGAARIEFFEARIRPVLVEHCYSCHSGAAKAIKGGLRLDWRGGWLAGGDSGAAIAPGRPEESLVLQALKFEALEMPPAGKLSPRTIADFERWIRDGAADPRAEAPGSGVAPSVAAAATKGDRWAFAAPQLTPPPAVADAAWRRPAIDPYIHARLAEAGLQPSEPAPPRTLIRRASANLLGLPPSPEEVDAFVREAADDFSGAYERLVERLLSSPHYGERWARHWLDVARYAEDQAHTFKARNYPRGFEYRDWVVRSLNDDLPYDEFLRQQIAADLLDRPDRHRHLAALGVFALGPVYYAENVERAKALADEWDDRVDTLTRGMLGLTVSCARCHDHKYDPITMEDYYGLAGIFSSTQYQERPLAAPEQIARRRAADQLADAMQTEIDKHLAEQSRRLRPALVDAIPAYVSAAWTARQRRQAGDENKKLLDEIAKERGLSAALLRRWDAHLSEPQKLAQGFAAWKALLASPDDARGMSGDDAAMAAQRAGEAIAAAVRAELPRREALLRRFGENVAFVKPEDRATVEPGVIPLGNLFDDSSNVALASALSTDTFRARATADSLGVDRVAQGWGASVEIAEKIRFDFMKLGSSSHSYGAVLNDAWDVGGGAIRTRGSRGAANGRGEQGIGMHANALVTFDLDEIRRAGLLPPDQAFVFKVDKAGLNDDVHGSGASAYVAALVSKAATEGATDAILASVVNGVPLELATDDFTYYFAGEPPPPLRPDGRFVSFAIDVPGEARHLTLVTTGAAAPDDNPISSDHTVFSGARLEWAPLPAAEARALGAAKAPENAPENAQKNAQKNAPAAPEDSPEDFEAAVLLSRFFYDEGLLALPAGEVEARLAGEPAERLAEMRQRRQELVTAAGRIAIPMAHALADAQSKDLPIYLSGDPAKPGAAAPRSMPAALTGGVRRPFEPAGSGRLELAEAVASPANPLTARVIVNRVWGWHFGQGLVRTPSNFGELGDRPSHPRLLDSLAVRFMQNGWSLKWLHKEILLSAAFRQASDFDERGAAADPENRLLWRMNRRRLEVEPWRDSMLSVTGELDRTLSGPSTNLEDAGNRRRTLYGAISRHRLNELLRLFDFPDPNITADQRSLTTVPLQQLFVLNSEFMTRRARALAERLRAERASDAERIQRAFPLLYCRAPDAEELAAGLQFLTAADGADDADDAESAQRRWEHYALALLSANEFMYID